LQFVSHLFCNINIALGQHHICSYRSIIIIKGDLQCYIDFAACQLLTRDFAQLHLNFTHGFW
jgi:hypothetical protein